MAQVFISYNRADEEEAVEIAKSLEAAGLSTWYYTRDSKPGPSYLLQIASAIAACKVMIVIVSRLSVESEQITSEIIQGFEQKKDFVPILLGVSHLESQKLQPEWRAAFRAATSIAFPKEGVESILPSLIDGLIALGISPETASTIVVQPTEQVDPDVTEFRPKDVSFAAAPRPTTTPIRVLLNARFDRSSYAHGEDSLAYWLAEFQLEPDSELDEVHEDDRLGADIALVLDVSGSMDKPNRYPLLREAVRRLVLGLGSQDRVCVILFTDRSKTVVPFLDGESAACDSERILQLMDNSGILFGTSTLLAPGLQLALDAFGPPAQSGGRARRTYVMTDGELHDAAESKTALHSFRSQSVEVHVYGFGEDFNATALKLMVSDQIGGTVKPIVNEQDIIQTFAHVANVNRRLVGYGAKLSITLCPNVIGGDAWVYQPHGRYLGPIRDRRIECEFGGIEAGRRYSLLLEVRLPTTDGPVATVEAQWLARDQVQSRSIEVTAVRDAGEASTQLDVQRAVDILHVLRAAEDPNAQLLSYKARRELAALENRDPELIAALDKIIAALSTTPPELKPEEVAADSWQEFSPSRELTDREQQLLDADPTTAIARPIRGGQIEECLLSELNTILKMRATSTQIMQMATDRLLTYVLEGFDLTRAAELLHELGLHIRLPRSAASRFKRQLIYRVIGNPGVS